MVEVGEVGGVCVTSKNLLQIRENMKELDFGFLGLPIWVFRMERHLVVALCLF